MSPELMSEKAYDTKSDIWSLGCMAYEMCALRYAGCIEEAAPPYLLPVLGRLFTMLRHTMSLLPLSGPVGYHHFLKAIPPH
jgi:serine/threonine protein kinase